MVTIIEIQTCEAVFDLTNLIFPFFLWRSLSCTQTAEVTELSVSFFYIALCNDLAGDSAWFHCVLWSFICLGCSIVWQMSLLLLSLFNYSVTFSFYILWKIWNNRMILIIYLGQIVEDAVVFLNKVTKVYLSWGIEETSEKLSDGHRKCQCNWGYLRF